MSKRVLLLIFGDVIISVLAIAAGFLMRLQSLPELSGLFKADLLFTENSYPILSFVLFIFVTIFSSFFVELYNHEKYTNKSDLMLKVMTGFIISFFILSALYYMMPFAMFGRGVLALSVISFGVLQFFWHLGYEKFLRLFGLKQRVLILGTGILAKQIGEIVTSTSNYSEFVGYINCGNETAAVPSQYIIGNGNGLVNIVRDRKADRIVVSLSERRGAFPLNDMLECKFSGVDVVEAPSFYEQLTGKLLIENTRPSSFIFDENFRVTTFTRVFKRVFDVTLALIGLIISLPLILLFSLLIKIDSRGPVFLKQVRVGRGEKRFVLYKFRTMKKDAEEGTGAVWTKENDPRITRFGRFLRSERFDEIPQLFNVLKGNMSFIGPRPERPEFVENLKKIIPYYSERHFVRPGITGWAQVKYHYGDSVESAIEKLKYDLYYIKNFSLFLELQIFFETIRVIIFGQGGR